VRGEEVSIDQSLNGATEERRCERLLRAVMCFVGVALIGGASWEVFAWQLLGSDVDVVVLRALIIGAVIGAVYAFLWELVWSWLGRRSVFATVVFGLVFPFLAMAIGLYGLWVIFLAIFDFWWVFLPAGLLTALVELRFRGRPVRPRKPPELFDGMIEL